jgi:hypothetical protein
MKSSRSRVRHLWSIAPKATHSNAAPFANQRRHGVAPMLHSPLAATLIGALIIAPGGGSLYPHPAEATVWTSASVLKNLRWYFRTYDDQSIRSTDLMKGWTRRMAKSNSSR